jgi:hypothetical protein
MRTSRFMGALGLCLGSLSLCGSVQGQTTLGYPNSGSLTQPVVSPYINLLRTGSPGYLNYYGLVRPETTLRNSLQGVQQQVSINQGAIDSFQASSADLSTGTHSYFLNSSRYFLNRGQILAPGTAGGTAGRPTTTTPNSLSGSLPGSVPGSVPSSPSSRSRP